MKYDDVMKLALERGFYFPSCEVYADAQAGFWEYGPAGVSLKNKFLELWRRELVRRDKMIEIDGSQIMSKSVFEASFTSPAFSPNMARRSFSSGVGSVSPFGVTLPIRISPCFTFAPMRMIPRSSN